MRINSTRRCGVCGHSYHALRDHCDVCGAQPISKGRRVYYENVVTGRRMGRAEAQGPGWLFVDILLAQASAALDAEGAVGADRVESTLGSSLMMPLNSVGAIQRPPRNTDNAGRGYVAA